jgi:hypothetical protein
MDISITFERTLYQAVIRFKQEHPGALEARTRQRNERRATDAGGSDRSEIRVADRHRTDRAERVPRNPMAVPV